MRRLGWRWWPFVALCLATTAELILPEMLPQATTTLSSMAGACGFLASCIACYAAIHREPLRSSVSLTTALAGVCALCGPFVALFFRPKGVTGSDLLLTGCLVPVVIAVAKATREAEGLQTAELWPGIAGVGGLLLLLPQPRVHSIADVAVLVLLPILTGAGAVFLREQALAGTWKVAAGCGAAAVLCLGAALAENDFVAFHWLAFALNVTVLGCTLLTLRRVSGTRYGALFLLTPLIALLYGFALLRPTLTLRTAAGASMLTAGAAALLRTRRAGAPEPGLLL